MPISLDELLNLPPDLDEEHLRRLNLLPPPAPPQAAPSIIPNENEPVKVPAMSPVTVTANPPATEATHEAAPKLQPLTPQVSPDAVTPMKPPTYLESPQSSMMGFGSREEARRAGQDLSAPVSAGPTLPTTESGRQEVELARLRDENKHPWGTPENHPGFFGKLGHVLSRVGNIAGDIVAPSTMALIPGTDLNRRVQEGQTERRLETAQTQEREAAKEKSEEGLRKAQSENLESETEERRGKNEQSLVTDAQGNVTGWKDKKGLHSLDEPGTPQSIKDIASDTANKLVPKYEKMDNGDIVSLTTHDDGKVKSEVVYHGDPKVKTETKEVLKNGKPHAVVFDVTNPNDKENFGKELKDLGETKVPPEPGSYLPVTDARGNTVGWANPKERNFIPVSKISGLAEAATGNAGATALPQKPTTQMRNVGAQAQVAVDGIPDVIKELTAMKDSLGPIEGRWNEFIQGKVGMENPQFAGLRADLLMLSSAVALAHARGRLPENLREEFDAMMNAPKQKADNLISVINHIEPWMKRMSDIGIQESAKGAETVPPKVGDVVDGHKFKGGDPSKKENWEKVVEQK